MKHQITFLVNALALISPLMLSAQYSVLDLPRVSQHATVMQRVGTTDITVDYSRPA